MSNAADAAAPTSKAVGKQPRHATHHGSAGSTKRRLNQPMATATVTPRGQPGSAPKTQTAQCAPSQSQQCNPSKRQRQVGERGDTAHHLTWSAHDITEKCHDVNDGKCKDVGLLCKIISQRILFCHEKNPHTVLALPKTIVWRPCSGEYDQAVQETRATCKLWLTALNKTAAHSEQCR